ncbi:MAG: hypothetical protein OXI91_06525 [Chloroflexota bacterium]|nr:hypothetical protein [Chloroflexota bacterium]
MPAFKTGKQIVQARRELKSGGEGTVFLVDSPDYVAKIYNDSFYSSGGLSKRGRLAEQKLTAMIENAPPNQDADGRIALAWPDSILYHHDNDRDGLMAGFLMPKIDLKEYEEIINYWNPKLRKRNANIPDQGEQLEELLYVIITNILTVLNGIHNLGYVIGDINEGNILVDYAGRVAFLDADSFQVTDSRNNLVHRCGVGTEPYMSPRVVSLTKQDCTESRCPSGETDAHNRGFACFDRNRDDDNFAIAVVLFKLLMWGTHPFDGPDGALKDKIAGHMFPYNNRTVMPPERTRRRWAQLSPQWQNYFGRTFVSDRRYTPTEVLGLGPPLKRNNQPNLGRQRTVSWIGRSRGGTNSAAPATGQGSASSNAGTNNGANSSGGQTGRHAAGPPPTPPQPQKVKCPRCDAPNDHLEIFCQEAGCQEPLARNGGACRACNRDIPVNAIYCPKCGEEQYPGQVKSAVLGKR